MCTNAGGPFARGMWVPVAITVAILMLATATNSAYGQKEVKEHIDPITSNSRDEAGLIRRLQKMESTGQLEDMEIEYWIGGGLPPPYYRSDQLRFLVLEGRPTIVLNVATRVPERPEVATVRFQAPLGSDELQKVAKLLRETGVFPERNRKEEKAGPADALRTEISLLSGDRTKEVKKTFYGAAPMGLEPLLSEIRRITDRVRQEGTRRYLDRSGREVR